MVICRREVIGLSRAKPNPGCQTLNKISGVFDSSEIAASRAVGFSLPLGPSINTVIGVKINFVKLSTIAKLTRSNGTPVAVRREPNNRMGNIFKDIGQRDPSSS